MALPWINDVDQVFHYLLSPSPSRVDPAALVIASVLTMTLVVVLYRARRPRENCLDEQVYARLSAGVAVWSVVEIVLVLWSMLGMGDPRLIPALGLLIGLLLLTYNTWYISWRLPTVRQEFDRLRAQLEAPYAQKQLRNTPPAQRSSSGWPAMAAGIGALILWLALFPSADHALHWLMISGGAALGYSVGLTLTAGSGVFTLAHRDVHDRQKKQARRVRISRRV